MAPRGETLRIKGYRELLRATSRADKESKKELRAALREAGEPVRAEAARLFDSVDARTASGYRVRVRQTGVAVEQSLRRTTGKRPDYGAKQMVDALIPALETKENEVERSVEHALDRIADHFER